MCSVLRRSRYQERECGPSEELATSIPRGAAHESAGTPAAQNRTDTSLVAGRNEKGDIRAGSARFRKDWPSHGYLFDEIGRLIVFDEQHFAIIFVHPDTTEVDLGSFVGSKKDVFMGRVLFAPHKTPEINLSGVW